MAYRDTGDFEKRLAAEPAIGRVEEGKKGARGSMDYRNADICAQAT